MSGLPWAWAVFGPIFVIFGLAGMTFYIPADWLLVKYPQERRVLHRRPGGAGYAWKQRGRELGDPALTRLLDQWRVVEGVSIAAWVGLLVSFVAHMAEASLPP